MKRFVYILLLVIVFAACLLGMSTVVVLIEEYGRVELGSVPMYLAVGAALGLFLLIKKFIRKRMSGN